MNKIITINREFGSGGREVAKRVADILSIAYYDKELVDKIAEETKYNPEYIENFSEAIASRSYPLIFSKTLMSIYSPPNDNIQSVQTKIIRDIANMSSCVIVGRCASDILRKEKILKVFIYSSDMEQRINRCYEKVPADREKSREEMKKLILSTDKAREKYHNYYTLNKWKDMMKYNLCIDTSKADVKIAAQIIADVYNNL